MWASSQRSCWSSRCSSTPRRQAVDGGDKVAVGIEERAAALDLGRTVGRVVIWAADMRAPVTSTTRCACLAEQERQ